MSIFTANNSQKGSIPCSNFLSKTYVICCIIGYCNINFYKLKLILRLYSEPFWIRMEIKIFSPIEEAKKDYLVPHNNVSEYSLFIPKFFKNL